ncbi:DUF4386 domain-containing protein [Pseudarthrobacter sp. P1]|uniref:DUF4386 domain-containing protein n=1 Tax=Pseudarthrobacter sp. P1 TaxID=3418418 RepID=UPI003CE9E44C
MATTDRTRATQRVPMDSLRKTALVAGVLYLITFSSIPILGLYAGAGDPNFAAGPGPDTPIIIGCILELIVALAGIGTAVALYPVVKRQNEGIALGVVGARILEAGTMFAGVACMLALVTLRQAGEGANALATGQTLYALHNWFFIGQNLMPAANALLLGSLMYQSRLVPRALPIMGFIGAPLLIASTVATIFGLNDLFSAWSGLAALPVAAWEFSLGLRLTFKGFKPSPITAGMGRAGSRATHRDAG